MTNDFKQCLTINCKQNNYSIGNDIAPKTYFLCNTNTSKSIEEALCSLPEQNILNWFDGVRVETLLYDAFPQNQAYNDCLVSGEFPPQTCLNNSVCCFTNHPANLLQESACSESMNCSTPVLTKFTAEEEEFGNLMTKIFTAFVFLIGMAALLGNIAVIIHSVKTLRTKGFKQITESQIYNILILSLALADMLMGLYVVSLSVNSINYIIKHYYGNETIKNEGSIMCLVLGLINFISSQVSLTAITTVTALRLFSVLFPYKQVRLSFICGIIGFTWIFWISVACVPLAEMNTLDAVFTEAIRVKFEDRFVLIGYQNLYFLIEKITTVLNRRCGFSAHVKYELTSFPTWETLLNISKNLKLVPKNIENNITYLGFYNGHWVCTMKFYLSHKNPASLFTLPILTHNIIAFVFIVVAQIIIAWKATNLSIGKRIRLCGIRLDCMTQAVESGRVDLHQRRKMEDRKMHRRMFYIVLTDFFCWIPLSLVALDFYGRSIFASTCKFLEYKRMIEYWIPVLILFVLPINSALNPFIYSFRFWKPIRKRCCFCCTNPAKTKEINAQQGGTSTSSAPTNKICSVQSISASIASHL